MGKAMQMIVGQVTAPSTTLTALTMNTGDSLTLQYTGNNDRIYMLAAWVDCQTAGQLRIRSPKMHDNSSALTLNTVASELEPLWPLGYKEKLGIQDTLSASLSGSGTSGDIETAAMLLYYDDLPGVDARLMTWAQIEPRIEKTMTTSSALSLGTTGNYSGEVAVNGTLDQFVANYDYACLGYTVTAECAAIGFRGPDTGRMRIGGPGHAERFSLTANWFKNLSLLTGLATIPIINANNKALTLLDGVQDENGTDSTVTLYWARLSR